MVAEGRPDHGFLQNIFIDVEDSDLVLGIRAGTIGIVAQHQPQIGVTLTRVIIVRVTHLRLQAFIASRAGGSGIADYPGPNRLTRAGLWRGDKVSGAVRSADWLFRVADGVMIFGRWHEARHYHDVLGRFPFGLRLLLEFAGLCAEAHCAVGWDIGAPAYDNAVRRSLLEVRAANDLLGDERSERERQQGDGTREDGGAGGFHDKRKRRFEQVRNRSAQFAVIRVSEARASRSSFSTGTVSR